MSTKSGILVLGVGNDILMDDGIGPVITNQLACEFPLSGIDFETINLGGLEIFEFIKEYNQVIIIDAIKTRNGVPGDVYYLTPSDFKETCHLSSFHDISFLTALKLGDKIGYDMPEVGIIAIEIVEDLTFGTEFSPQVSIRYPSVYNEIKEFLIPILERKRSVKLSSEQACV
jgi:hydrogenase maturation protease